MVVYGIKFFNFVVSEVPSEISTHQMHEHVIYAPPSHIYTLLPVSLFSFPKSLSTFNFPVVLPCLGGYQMQHETCNAWFFFRLVQFYPLLCQWFCHMTQPCHFWCTLWWSINHASCLPWFAMPFRTARTLLIGPFPPLWNTFFLITSMKPFDD